MLKWCLCDYSKAEILAKGTITVVGKVLDAVAIAAERTECD